MLRDWSDLRERLLNSKEKFEIECFESLSKLLAEKVTVCSKLTGHSSDAEKSESLFENECWEVFDAKKVRVFNMKKFATDSVFPMFWENSCYPDC